MLSHQLIAGSATLGKLHSRKAVAAMVDRLVANGLTTFDTAPLYGEGCMETLLGGCLAGRPEILINTKFGLEVPVDSRLLRKSYFVSKVVQKLARKLVPSVHVSRAADIVRHAETSLSRSLDELGLPIDVFFAHEVPISLLETADFIQFLQSAKRRGLFRRFGLGGYRRQYEITEFTPIWHEVDVVQVESIPGQPVRTPQGWEGEVFLHGVLSTLRPLLTQGRSKPTALAALAYEAMGPQNADRLVVGFSRGESLEEFVHAISTFKQ
ncbi:MAG TPA: aldo/keto reductase [Luteolibacter sp.]